MCVHLIDFYMIQDIALSATDYAGRHFLNEIVFIWNDRPIASRTYMDGETETSVVCDKAKPLTSS